MEQLDVEFDFVIKDIDGIRKSKKYHTARICGEITKVCFRFGSVLHYSDFKTSDVAMYLNCGMWRRL